MVNIRTNSGKAAFVTALTAVAVGGSVLIGWLFEPEHPSHVVPGHITMNPATAVAFILTGVSLALLLRFSQGGDQKSRGLVVTARLCACAAIFIGWMRLVAIFSGWDLGVDQWLFASQMVNGPEPGNHVAPNSALNLLLLGGAVLLMDVESRSVRCGVEIAVLVVGLISLLAILGYAYGVEPFYRVGPFGGMAMHTAITSAILSVGVLLSHTDGGLLAGLAGNNTGGTLTRRLLPPAVLITALISWVSRMGEKAGYPVAFCDAAATLANIGILTFLICWTARRLSNGDVRRRKAEDETRFNEQRYRSLVEATAAIVWVTDASGQFVVEQPDWTAFTGQVFQELRGWGWLKSIHPDDQTETARAWSVAVANRSIFQVEHRVRTQRGVYRNMLVRAAPILAANGPILEWIGVHSDITERKQAEAWRIQLAAIIESSGDAIVSKDFDSNVTSWNTAAERMFGYSAREMVGTSIRRLIPPDRQGEEEEIMSSIERGERTLYFETVRLTKSGGRIDVSITVSPIKDAAGKVVGASKIARDITGKKQAEAELRWKTALLEAQVNSSLDGILVVDGQGKKLLQNQRLADLLKIPPHIAEDTDDQKQVSWVTGVTRNPAAFTVKVAYLFSHPDETSRDEIELTDGTFLDRYSAPVVGNEGTYFGRIWTFRDITVRKRAEESLRLLESAVEQSKESIMITDAELDLPGPRIVFVNPAFTQMTGYTAEEVLGKTPRLFQGPRTDRKVLDRLRRNLAAGEAFEGETTNYRKDGSPFVLAWQITPIREGNGPITHFVAVERDITEQTRSAALLLESQQRLTLATESAGIGIWEWSPMKNEGVWDAQMLTLYGLRSQDFTSVYDAWRNGLHPEDRARAESEFAAALAGPRDFQSEFRVVWPGGEVHDIQAYGIVPRAADGSAQRMVGVNWDVTARKQTEARFRRLVDSDVQSILFWNAEGRITGANDSFLSLTGYNREDLVAGRLDWMAMTPPEYADFDRRALAGIAATGTCTPYEKEFIRKDGTRVPILVGAAAFEDNPEEGVCFVLDLTERKRLETQLVESQKLETVGKLAGGIAHEFNSILTAIIGQSELLLSDLPSGSPLKTNATEITTAAGRAAALTRQLLAYGRKQLLQPEALDFNRVATRMEGMLRHLMGGEIDTRIVATDGLHAVKADVGQLEQVIMQMAINARDAMPNGGKFTLETANVSFDQESVGNYPELKPGDYVMLAITDTGVGMSAEVKARLFEPFFSTKGVGQGTGLGLSTCYGIIKQSGGHISVYSELARGATFKIYLPQVERSATAPPRRPAPTDLPRGTETILLVEDDPALREMASALLRRLGYTVLAAANGIEALSLKQQRGTGHVDLLFTDVAMPHMSGKELADRVRALYPHTRILFTSAYTKNAIVHQNVLSKGVALLQKPFMPSALAHKVREVLDQPGEAVSRD